MPMASNNGGTRWHLTKDGWRGATADSPDAVDDNRPVDTMISVLAFSNESADPLYLNIEF
jgi:hypothetical protein